MDRGSFADRFDQAVARALACARSYVEETLPDAARFRVCLNASYDGNPLHADERVHPDDHLRHATERLDRDAVIELLWREGEIPEWIDVNVVDSGAEITLVELMCCGRFTANQALLYHEREGIPPFHVVGPYLPPDWDHAAPRRFSLHWMTTLRDREGLARLQAAKVRILTVEGDWFDDEMLASLGALPSLMTLRLEGTGCDGSGLAGLTANLQHLALHGAKLQLASLARFPGLRSVDVSGQSLDGSAAWGRALDSVTVRVPSFDAIDFPTAALEWLNLEGTTVSSLAPLAQANALLHLLLGRTRAGDLELRQLSRLPRLRSISLDGTTVSDEGVEQLAGIPTLRSLDFSETRVTDATLRAVAALPELMHVDVRKTGVTHEAIAELMRANPNVHVKADGWTKLPRRLEPQLTILK